MTTYSTVENFLQPVLQYIGSTGFWMFRRHQYRLVVDYYFEWGKPTARKRIFMKRGFEFDKGTKPKFGAVLGFTTDGETDGASMIHDRAYRDRGKWQPGQFEFQVQIDDVWVPDDSTWSRSEHDALYEFVAVAGGYAKPAAFLEKITVKFLWPPNWFKGF